jgi:hypothetical protein
MVAATNTSRVVRVENPELEETSCRAETLPGTRRGDVRPFIRLFCRILWEGPVIVRLLTNKVFLLETQMAAKSSTPPSELAILKSCGDFHSYRDLARG